MIEIEKYVTYLFGAGASAKKLPLNDGLIEDILNVLIIEEYENDSDQIFFNKNINNIIEKAKLYGSLDTYAKICVENDLIDELSEIKRVIWLYFTIIYNKKRLDDRYLKLLTKICVKPKNGYARLNSKVNILSWNYDLQIEEAIILLEKSLDNTKSGILLNAFPNIRFVVNNPDENSKKLRPEDGALIHLNGVAGHSFDNGNDFAHVIDNLEKNNLIERNKKFIRHTSRGIDSHISDSINFGWEKNNITNIMKDAAIEIAKKTEHLVVIGYSFPELNREVDELIIHNMVNLNAITFQTTDSLAIRRLKDIIGNNEKLKDLEIHILDNYYEFYLPLRK